ncbi:MAG: outer membrane beta-barrel domain-containing protein [bacterium]
MKRKYVSILVFMSVFFFLTEAYAKSEDINDPENKYHVYAIQEKIFHYSHELGLNFGYFPDDDFYELYPVSGSYIFHFNDQLAWEVVRGTYIINKEKTLRKDLRDKFNIVPTEFSKMIYMFHSHVILKPFYGKEAVFNRGIINNETYFFAGMGMVSYETKAGTLKESVPSLSFGMGLKYFISRHLSLNFEIRDLENFREDRNENNLSVGMGAGFRFNLAPRKTEEDSTLKLLKQYLRDKEEKQNEIKKVDKKEEKKEKVKK